MRVFVLAFLLMSTHLVAKEQKQKTLFKDGVYAASYGQIGLDLGSIHDYSLSLVRFSFGVQLLRYEDYVSWTVGFQKSGFHDGLRNHDTTDKSYQIDYTGATTSFLILPNSWIYGDITYHINNKGKGSEKISTIEKEVGDVRYRYDYKVSEISFSVAVRVNDLLAVTLGFGQREITWDSKISNFDTTVPESRRGSAIPLRPKEGSTSGSFIMLGIRGSTI